MAPHLSKKELDRCFSLYAAGKTPVEIRDLVSRTRESLDETGPDLTTVRRALRRATHKRGSGATDTRRSGSARSHTARGPALPERNLCPSADQLWPPDMCRAIATQLAD